MHHHHDFVKYVDPLPTLSDFSNLIEHFGGMQCMEWVKYLPLFLNLQLSPRS